MGDVKGERLRLLGIEPRAPDLESDMLPLHHSLDMIRSELDATVIVKLNQMLCAHKKCHQWDSNPRSRNYGNLSATP